MEILNKLAIAIERGKIDIASPHPPDMLFQDGADELTRIALESGIPAEKILSEALIPGMTAVGQKFARNEVFIPDILLSARAMAKATEHLKPYFQSGELKTRGIIVMGTVRGDLHDIGKKIVGMMFEGGGWKVVDLGVDVPASKFIEAVGQNPGCAVGLSALLTTTMNNMRAIVEEIKIAYPDTLIIVGGAPVTGTFASGIGADAYFADPQGALEFLNSRLPGQ
jgi:5-methyltetrahydrofolate--homocysteine methyltransferase